MRFRITAVLILSVVVLVLLTGSEKSIPAEKHRVHVLLAPYESGDKKFEEIEIADKYIVYHHSRMIGDAIVERDYITYQFDKKTNELIARRSRWRDDIPDELPANLISADEAIAIVGGNAESAILHIISPNSEIFRFKPTPTNPCWVVRSVDENGFISKAVVDAVEARILGNGEAPPQRAYVLAGPYDISCTGNWEYTADSAAYWFEHMGYKTETAIMPAMSEVQSQIQSDEVAIFYEIAHGTSGGFDPGCDDGDYYGVSDDMLYDWINDYDPMRFTFLGSCFAMSNTGYGTISDAFRKSSIDHTVTVGYKQMPHDECENDCWPRHIEWQDRLFYYLSIGWTVYDAFCQANAEVADCIDNHVPCVAIAGDLDLTLIPRITRSRLVAWQDVSNSPLDDLEQGRGITWADYDDDGDQDIYLVNFGGPNKLFENNDGSFIDVTADAELNEAGRGISAAWADYDNDGYIDLYLINDYQSNVLYHNDGDGTFSVATTSPLDDTGLGRGVAWGDYDNDGYVDLYLANHGQANKLFRNNGDGTFSDETTGLLGDTGNGEGVAWGDHDNDRDLDLYIVNFDGPNKLLNNNGDGTFSDATSGPLGDSGFGKGVAWGDYDNDGDLDICLVNLNGSKLFRNEGNGIFNDVAATFFGNDLIIRNGICFGDHDNDADLDIYTTTMTGHNMLLRNESASVDSFLYVSGCWHAPGCPDYGQGAAFADYDKDGDLDLYVANSILFTPNRLFQNGNDLGNSWLQVDLVGTLSNRSAIGARVRAVTGETAQIREISGGSGLYSQDALTASFGFGSATQVDTLEVYWPSGIVYRAVDVPVNDAITIEEQQPYPPLCDFAQAPDPPECRLICPAGDISYDGRAPIRLEVTLRDALGVPIEGYDRFYALVTPSQTGNFTLCCAELEPTVESPTIMLPSAPTDINGKAWFDIFWGGGSDKNLGLTCFLDNDAQIQGELVIEVKSPDINGDCSVDLSDLSLLGDMDDTRDFRGNFDCKGKVGRFDHNIFEDHYLHSCGIESMPPPSEEIADYFKMESASESAFDDQEMPDVFSLAPNVPNPFNPSTRISYTVPAPGAHVVIEVFDVNGRLVKVLLNEYRAAGKYNLTWEGINEQGNRVQSGIYFCRLKAADFIEERKMVLVR